MLNIWNRQKNSTRLEKLTDFELFECYKRCNIECFGYLYEKYNGFINSVLVKTFGDQFIIDYGDIFQDKVLKFLEKGKSEKKDLNKEKNKNIKSFLITAFKNHGFDLLDNVKNKKLYLKARRTGNYEYEGFHNDTIDIEGFNIEIVLKELDQYISLNRTQKDFLKLYCQDYNTKEIAKLMDLSKSYTENLLTQIRKMAKESENKELIMKIINREL